MYQPQPPQLAKCPYCQIPTLVNGNFCAYCGRQFRQVQGAPASGYPPSVYQQGPPQQQPQTAPGGRSMLVCSHCGVQNEPWLTNCKACQRPLGSTAHA